MLVEVSIGEVVDKATILEIKKEKFSDKEKLKNVIKEYDLLIFNLSKIGISPNDDKYKELKDINLKLWHIEDDIRIKEYNKEFDEEFIKLARSVYVVNDERATVKKEINIAAGSELIEEKEYIDYKGKNEEN